MRQMEQEITKETKERVFAKVKSPFVVFVSFCSNSVAPIESFFALLSLSLLLGCGDGKSSASGTVTFDGQPVASGTITFVKSDGELVREGAIIKDGAFQAHVPPG